jgi:His-Xaa-Ser system protein HxsD
LFGEAEVAVEDERPLTVDTDLYSLRALFRACYAFTDRCYLFLRDAAPGRVTVVFRKRQSAKTLDALIEEFANELVSQGLRAQLEEETRAIRERIVAMAFSEADL